MQVGAITSYIDVAQVVLYGFWVFFAGLIYYLYQENKREGYPLESTSPGRARIEGFPPVPSPKTYLLADGTSVTVPRAAEMARTLSGISSTAGTGEPTELGMGAGIGPGAYAIRRDIPDVTIDGAPKIVPLRADPTFGVSAKDVDPRGLPVVGTDGVVGGRVIDVWVDRSETMFRYLEVEAPGAAGPVLLPVNFARIGSREVVVDSVNGKDFAAVPRTRQPNVVTFLEEERITAYFGAGTLYATAGRAEPLL